MRLGVRRTAERVIGRGAAFGRERGSCGGRFLATPGRRSTRQHGRQAEEGRELRVPMPHAMDHAAALSHDLAGNLPHCVHERFELHPQPAGARRLVRRAVTRRDRQQQRRPGFQSPGQTRHDHVGPVADQALDRSRQRAHAAGDLGDQVLLVAAVVAAEDDLGRRGGPIVGDIRRAAADNLPVATLARVWVPTFWRTWLRVREVLPLD